MTERRAAEVFPPSEFIKEELDARNWSQVELAEIMGRSPKDVSDLISGKRAISVEIAKDLGSAFGTDPRYWINLDSIYRLQRLETSDDAVARRARLYEWAPIREIVKRNWLAMSDNIDVLEQRAKRFFEASDLDAPAAFSHAARRRTQEMTSAHVAWLYRGKQLAHAVHAKPFSSGSFASGMGELKRLLPNTRDVRHVPKTLAEAGIRFLVIEGLPRTGIDGVTFWLDAKSPVIVLSLRYDRVDWFWFTLFHEMGHVSRQDGLQSEIVIDTDLVGEDMLPEEQKTDSEKEADKFAAESLVKQSELDSFIARVDPLYSKPRIAAFAAKVGVHPGIVVGQLHHRKVVPYRAHRQVLDQVRNIVTQSALTDGWGHMPPTLS